VLCWGTWRFRPERRPGRGRAWSSSTSRGARLVRLDYKPEAAQDSWRRILAFFSEHLQG